MEEQERRENKSDKVVQAVIENVEGNTVRSKRVHQGSYHCLGPLSKEEVLTAKKDAQRRVWYRVLVELRGQTKN